LALFSKNIKQEIGSYSDATMN